MARGDLQFDIGVSIDNAIRNLDAFNAKVQTVASNFEGITSGIRNMAVGLTATLGGLATSAALFADQINDVAQANEASIASVLGLASALQDAGGNADSVGRMFLEMNKNIEDANGGNLKMVDSFGKLGITIKDLGTTATEEIRNRLIRAIAEIEDPAERSAKAIEMFGKSAVGVDFRQLARDLDDNVNKYSEYEDAVRTASDAVGQLDIFIRDLKVAAAVAFEPLFKFIKGLNIDIQDLVVIIRILGAALAAAVGATVLAGFAKLIDLVTTLTVVARKNPIIAIASAVLGVATAMGVWKATTEEVTTETDKLNKEIEKSSQKTQTTKRDQTGLNGAIQKQKDTLSQISENYNRQLQNIQEKIKLEGDFLRMSETEKKLVQERANIENQTQNALLALKQRYEGLDANARAARKADYEKEREQIERNGQTAIRLVEEQIRKNQEYANSIKNLGNAMAAMNTGRETLFDIQARNQISLAGIQERIIMEERYNAILRIRQALVNATAGLSEEERNAALQAISISTTRTQNLGVGYDKLNTSIESHIQLMVRQGAISQDTANKIIENSRKERDSVVTTSREIQQTNQDITAQSRTFEFGWSKAFREYVDNAENAATRAENIFRKMTQGMEDLLVNFVKTGKFEWKNFVASMLEELLRSQIRQAMASIFQMGGNQVRGGGGGLFGGSIIPGILAEGGPVSSRRPYIVGERGPELFVPNSAGSMVPNRDLMGSTNVTYNISAVDAMSFKQLIARDPAFIHAVASQGGKSSPVRR